MEVIFLILFAGFFFYYLVKAILYILVAPVAFYQILMEHSPKGRAVVLICIFLMIMGIFIVSSL
jgi:hypothetical protein